MNYAIVQYFADRPPPPAAEDIRGATLRMENAAFVCVTEFLPGPPTVSSKRTDSPSHGAPRLLWSVVVAEGSRLPGRASDFSHGSQPLGRTAGVLSPVTSFHEGSNEGQESLRNTERTTV